MRAEDLEALRGHMLAVIAAGAFGLRDIIGKSAFDQRVMTAMGQVPRHAFVPIELQPYAYENIPLPIGFAKTISQPFIVALMTDLLDIKADDNVLEIGTGLGYQAAILAQLARKVYSVEIIEELGQAAKQRLRQQRYNNVELKIANGYRGWSEHAPFCQGDRDGRSRSHSSSAAPPIESGWENGDTGRPAQYATAHSGREARQRHNDNERDSARPVLSTRGR